MTENTAETNVVNMPKRSMKMVSIKPTETIRNRLNLTGSEFSEALGLAPHSYNAMIARGKVTSTVTLAAECLSRRHRSAPAEEQTFIVTVGKAGMAAVPIAELKTMTFDGVDYVLVPVKGAKQ